MSKEKKLKKKKEREKKNKQQVVMRREMLRKEQKVKHDEYKHKKDMKKLLKEKEKLEAMNEQIIQKLPPDVREKIEHNIQILKALEEEHAKEMAAKKKINDGLESKGYLTLEQKLSALNTMQKLSAETEFNEDRKVGGSADCSMAINETNESE